MISVQWVDLPDAFPSFHPSGAEHEAIVMGKFVGIELHAIGVSLATRLGDTRIGVRPDADGSIARTSDRRWKWFLGGDPTDPDAVTAARRTFTGIQRAFGDQPVAAGIAIPACWNERSRDALRRSVEGLSLGPVRLVRDSTALALGAATADASVQGLCAFVDLGAHKLEIALAEAAPNGVRVLARRAAAGIDGTVRNPDALKPLVEAMVRMVFDDAAVAPSDVLQLIAAGQRMDDASIAAMFRAAFRKTPVVRGAGTIALGAARIIAGACDEAPRCAIDDDLGETPLNPERASRPPPEFVPRTVTPAPMPRAPSTPTMPRSATPVSMPRSMTPTPMPRAPSSSNVLRSATPLSTPMPRSSSSASVTRVPGATPSSVTPRVEVRSGSSGDFVAEAPRTGAFTGLTTLASVMALRVAHPVDVTAMQRPNLAALLNQFTFVRDFSGIVALQRGTELVAIPIDRGGVCLSPLEAPKAMRCFDWPDGTFTTRAESLPPAVSKLRFTMSAFVASCLRNRLRAFDEAALSAAYAPKLRQAISIVDDRRNRLDRMSLPENERRALDALFDGRRALDAMLGDGALARPTLLRLVVLLEAFDVVRWTAASSTRTPATSGVLAERLKKMEGRNHFEALDVHWSAPGDEVRAAFEKICAEFGPAGRWYAVDPEACRAIVQRATDAWTVLQNESAKVKHRREMYPGLDEDQLASLVEDRAMALQMKGESASARAMQQLRGEMKANEVRRKPR